MSACRAVGLSLLGPSLLGLGLLGLGLASCGSNAGRTSVPSGTSVPAGASPTPAASGAATATLTAAPSTPTGKWVSPSCGARAYPRELELFADGRFTARDLVSPCPQGVSCVWSGIVERAGRFTVAGARLELAIEKGEATRGGQALPESFAIEGGAPVEESAGARCTYTRA
jgi:hypothetical protein